MNVQEKEAEYINILDSLQKLKNGVVNDCTNALMLTGLMPDKAQKELKVFANVTGAVFCGINELGVPLTENPEQEGLVFLTLGGKTFNCAKANLILDKISSPLSVSEAYSVSAPEVKVTKEEKIEEKKVEPVVEEPLPSPTVNTAEEDEYEEEDEPFEMPTSIPVAPKAEEPAPVSTPAPTPVVDEEEYEEEEDEYDAPSTFTNVEEPAVEEPTPAETLGVVNMGSIEEEEYEEEEDTNKEDDVIIAEPEEEVVKPEPPKSGARIIGATPMVASSFSAEDLFFEEQIKNGNEFVYNYSKISVMHTEMGSRPEEMHVLIAPLKITKYSCTSVPIVVTVMHNGKTVTASSYDTKDTGKNIVLFDINEYYFLARGSIDDKGNFKATLTTTGISANQGDKINVISSKTYGNCQNKAVGNGHVKFRYTAETGPGTIEVFPFGDIGDEDFVAIVKNEEFVDYYVLSKSLRANQRPIIYTEAGEPSELLCHWDGDVLQVELL